MSPTWTICRRDLVAAFTAPLAWLILACWTGLINGVFMLGLWQVHGTPGAGEPLYVQSLGYGVFFLILLAPALTMNAFPQERAQGTMQLLLTVPVREHHLVLGKFLAAFLTLAALVAATLPQPITLLFVSEVGWTQLAAGYLGLLLCAAFFAALGVWISLLVDSPVAAYVITFAAIAVLGLLGAAAGDDSMLAPVGRAVGLSPRTAGFFRGQIRLGDCTFLLAGAAAFLTMAHGALGARRLHG